jgi:hypothetical protein
MCVYELCLTASTKVNMCESKIYRKMLMCLKLMLAPLLHMTHVHVTNTTVLYFNCLHYRLTSDDTDITTTDTLTQEDRRTTICDRLLPTEGVGTCETYGRTTVQCGGNCISPRKAYRRTQSFKGRQMRAHVGHCEADGKIGNKVRKYLLIFT